MIHYGHDRDLVLHIRDGMNPGSMFVDTRVGGVLVKGTLDTGAAVSVLHESVFRDMSEEIRNSLMPRPGSLTTATGTPIPILGCVDVIVRLKTVDGPILEMPQVFTVVTGLNCQCILGFDFMDSYVLSHSDEAPRRWCL